MVGKLVLDVLQLQSYRIYGVYTYRLYNSIYNNQFMIFVRNCAIRIPSGNGNITIFGWTCSSLITTVEFPQVRSALSRIKGETMKHTKNIPRKSGFNHGSVQYLYIYLCVFTYISRTLVTPKRTNTYIETLCSSISSGCDYCCRPFLRKSLGNPSSVNGACWMCTSVDMARAQTAQRHGAKPSPPR